MNAERRTQSAERRKRFISKLCVLRSALCVLVALNLHAGSTSTSRSAALSTAHPLATKVGLSVLQKGGNAIDASVAIAFALAVVHPQAGNLGGGGFLTYYDVTSRAVWTLDFTEIAPLAVKKEMFAEDASAARNGPRAVGVPGTVAGLGAMHHRFGKRPWKELLEPAIGLARDGFTADAELVADAERAKQERKIDAFPGVAAGAALKQPELAATLERIASNGIKDFYEGETGAKLVDRVRDAGGVLGFRDLREYTPMWRAPLKLRFGAYDIYTVAPPSGGGLVIGETLNILAGDDLTAAGFQNPKTLHLIAEAQRRAYIDRNKYLADPFGTRIPFRELLSRRRADAWRKTIDIAHATPTTSLTEPTSLTSEGEHTTHFVVADAKGNVASVTVTLGDNFGSGFMPAGLGFFLNNAMDDFTAPNGAPNRDGLRQGGVNAVEPGKRAATSMAPTIVLRDEKPYLAIGTRGGPAIPTTILQVFLNVAVYGKSLPDAVAAPRWHHQGSPEDIFYERGRAPQKTIDALNALGHGVSGREAIGDVHAILIEKNRMIAVADPRRGGAAGGY